MENEQEETHATISQSARNLERIGWITLLVCALDLVLGLNILGPTLRVFLSALAATLLILGIIVRKQGDRRSK